MRNIAFLSFLLYFNSCNDVKKNRQEYKPIKIEHNLKKTKVTIIVNDTMVVNNKYKCLIEVKRDQDPSSTSSHKDSKEEIGNRDLIYRFCITDRITSDLEKLQKKIKDTMKGDLTGEFVFYKDLVFNKTGIFYIDGILEDNVYLKMEDTTKYMLVKDEGRLNFKITIVK